MEITEWQKLFVDAVNQKYPKWTFDQRLHSLHKQVSDVFYTHQMGEMENIPIQTRIADIFVDLFLICEEFDVDLEQEFSVILEWFRQKNLTAYERKIRTK